jgi:hypothetical protein
VQTLCETGKVDLIFSVPQIDIAWKMNLAVHFQLTEPALALLNDYIAYAKKSHQGSYFGKTKT